MQLIGTDIHHTWLPRREEAKAVVICVHGLGLHGGCFHSLGRTLSDLGYAVLAIDIRGLGCWQTWGDHKLSIRGCIDDLQIALSEIRHVYPGLPVFLAGESMGGAIALKTASLNESLLDGLILSAPVDSSRHYFNHWELWFKYYFAPNSPVSLVAPVIKRAACDEEMVNYWLNDSLAAKHVYARDLVAVRNLIRDNEHSAARIKETPVLVLQGYKDRLLCPRSIVSLFDRLPARQKELVYIGDADHLMLQSHNPDHRCLGVVAAWLEALVARLCRKSRTDLPAPFCPLRLVIKSDEISQYSQAA